MGVFRLKTLIPEELKRMQPQELLETHTRLHVEYSKFIELDVYTLADRNREDVVNDHTILLDTLKRKNIAHPPGTTEEDLDRRSSEIKTNKIKKFVKPNKPAKRIFLAEEYPTLEYEQALVQVKWDGVRVEIVSDGKVKFLTEDQGLDKTSRLPPHEKEIRELPQKDFILDGEAQMFSKDQPLHRTQTTGYLNSEAPVDKADSIRIFVFDIIRYDSRDLKDESLKERLEILDKFSDTDHITFCGGKNPRGEIAFSNQSGISATRKAMKAFGSEGAMIKDMASLYNFDNFNNKGWAKIKNANEIDVIVVEKIKTKAGAYNYLSAMGPISNEHTVALKDDAVTLGGDNYAVLGKTFSTAISVGKGDILRLEVKEIKKSQIKDSEFYRYNFQDPRVLEAVPEKKKPDGLHTADRIAEETLPTQKLEELLETGKFKSISEFFEYYYRKAADDEGETRAATSKKIWKEKWWKAFPKSGKGDFTYQHHWRGLTEEEKELSEESLFKTEHSIHGDLRLTSKREGWGDLFGSTVFLGTTKDAQNRLQNLKEPDGLEMTWKLPQPKGWMTVARGKPYLAKPGAAGTYTDTYAKFFEEDYGTFEIGVWREHAMEVFLNGKKLKGRFFFVYAPVGETGERKWLVKKPKDQTPYAQKHDIKTVAQELRQKNQIHLVWSRPGTTPHLIDTDEPGKNVGKCWFCNEPIIESEGKWIPVLGHLGGVTDIILVHRFECPVNLKKGEVVKKCLNNILHTLNQET